jgi:hypothetical protein
LGIRSVGENKGEFVRGHLKDTDEKLSAGNGGKVAGKRGVRGTFALSMNNDKSG